MIRFFGAALGILIAWSHCSVAGAGSLADLVKAFNDEVRTEPIANEQPVLTAAEVVASIRATDRKELLKRGVPNEYNERLQQVAETGEAPEGSELTSTTRFVNGNYVITVWWVDLHLPANPEDKIQWTHRIRDRKISSRLLTPDELRRMLERREQMQRQQALSREPDGGGSE